MTLNGRNVHILLFSVAREVEMKSTDSFMSRRMRTTAGRPSKKTPIRNGNMTTHRKRFFLSNCIFQPKCLNVRRIRQKRSVAQRPLVETDPT